jgi:hypothetical protein
MKRKHDPVAECPHLNQQPAVQHRAVDRSPGKNDPTPKLTGPKCFVFALNRIALITPPNFRNPDKPPEMPVAGFD